LKVCVFRSSPDSLNTFQVPLFFPCSKRPSSQSWPLAWYRFHSPCFCSTSLKPPVPLGSPVLKNHFHRPKIFPSLKLPKDCNWPLLRKYFHFPDFFPLSNSPSQEIRPFLKNSLKGPFLGLPSSSIPGMSFIGILFIAYNNWLCGVRLTNTDNPTNSFSCL